MRLEKCCVRIVHPPWLILRCPWGPLCPSLHTLFKEQTTHLKRSNGEYVDYCKRQMEHKYSWPSNNTHLLLQETSAWHRLSALPPSCCWSLEALLRRSRAEILTSSIRPPPILCQKAIDAKQRVCENYSGESAKAALMLQLPSALGVGMPASAAEAAAALRASSSCLCRCSSIDTRRAWRHTHTQAAQWETNLVNAPYW